MYVFTTWLLIIALHPVVCELYYFNFTINKDGYFPIRYPFILLYSLICAFIPILGSYLILKRILSLKHNQQLKFILWLIACCILVYTSFILAILIFKYDTKYLDIDIIIPGLITTITLNILRYPNFINYCNYHEK
jgi:hypothetical protein